MVKKIVLATLMASSAAMAGDWYMGVNVGSSALKTDVSAKNKTTGASASGESTDTKGGFGAKAGYEMDGAHRIEAEYIKFASNMSNTRLNYVYKYSLGDLKPYIGGGIGFANYKEDFTVGGRSYSFDKSSTAWNIKGGLIYEIAKKHEIELGYDYTSVGNMSEDYTIAGQNIELKLENTKVGRVYLGYNYRF